MKICKKKSTVRKYVPEIKPMYSHRVQQRYISQALFFRSTHIFAVSSNKKKKKPLKMYNGNSLIVIGSNYFLIE